MMTGSSTVPNTEVTNDGYTCLDHWATRVFSFRVPGPLGHMCVLISYTRDMEDISPEENLSLGRELQVS